MMSKKKNNGSNQTGEATPLSELREILELEEIADYLRCSYSQAWRLVSKGRLPRFGFTRRILVHRDHLDTFVREDGKLSHRTKSEGRNSSTEDRVISG